MRGARELRFQHAGALGPYCIQELPRDALKADLGTPACRSSNLARVCSYA
jgi:hypothetical protein